MNALVVDDSRVTRRVMGQILTGLGFSVAEAGDGREALARLAELGPVDLAVVDWNMPVMDGPDLVRAVRGDPALDRVRVMMVTTESDAATIAEALGAGADEFVMKPFTPDVIRENLQLLGIEPAVRT
ncbi:MAG: response regulator containing a CheY-like receiver domain and a domain [Gemmataceae bacterium]|nr:response regulator containing a CheY-like receiver domain and a domain [Gemmataceae bacterium]